MEKQRGRERKEREREGVVPERLTVLRSCVTAMAYQAYCPGNTRVPGTIHRPMKFSHGEKNKGIKQYCDQSTGLNALQLPELKNRLHAFGSLSGKPKEPILCD